MIASTFENFMPILKQQWRQSTGNEVERERWGGGDMQQSRNQTADVAATWCPNQQSHQSAPALLRFTCVCVHLTVSLIIVMAVCLWPCFLDRRHLTNCLTNTCTLKHTYSSSHSTQSPHPSPSSHYDCQGGVALG